MARQKYALVGFKPFGKEYAYACSDDVKAGNVVLVNVGTNGENKEAYVTDVSYFAEGALPCDKEQIRKVVKIISERDYSGKFYEDLNELFIREEPKYMNRLWARSEDYDEYAEQLPLYGDIEHKMGGRIVVFRAPTEYVIRYSIRDFEDGRFVAYSKAEMLGITKNLKSGIDFYMRHRNKIGDEFIEELFENPTMIPEIYDNTL